jgi:hypothetical protein
LPQTLSLKVSEKLEVFEYFGTTARVMLTMFELTLALLEFTWNPPLREFFWSR